MRIGFEITGDACGRPALGPAGVTQADHGSGSAAGPEVAPGRTAGVTGRTAGGLSRPVGR